MSFSMSAGRAAPLGATIDGDGVNFAVFSENAHRLYLCLFDAYNREWTPSDLLAETTVPWSSRYLFFYEGWLATKSWRGGGRHPTREEQDGIANKKAIAAV